MKRDGIDESAPSSRPTPVARTTPPMRVGSILGDRFEITGVLGEGGTGVVYSALRMNEDKSTPRESVALKVIHGHLLADQQIRGRFIREAKILRRLHGDHLCAILDCGELEDPRPREKDERGEFRPPLLYLALPRIEGPALDQLLRDDAPLAVPLIVDIASQICEGLAEAHAQGVIHRDLKPPNVILEPQKNGVRAIVVDFGMAKIVTGAGTDATVLTQQNMVFGTPEYMAPEQARGDELDGRCDIYALGVILYEMLCGQVPFAGASALNVLTAHLTQTPTRPRARGKHVLISDALEAVVLHALAKRPGDRYSTATALKDALACAVADGDDVDAVHPKKFEGAEVENNGDRTSSADAHAPTFPSLPAPADKTGGHRRLRERSKNRASTPKRVSPPNGWFRWVLAIGIGVAIGAWISLRWG